MASFRAWRTPKEDAMDREEPEDILHLAIWFRNLTLTSEPEEIPRDPAAVLPGKSVPIVPIGKREV